MHTVEPPSSASASCSPACSSSASSSSWSEENSSHGVTYQGVGCVSPPSASSLPSEGDEVETDPEMPDLEDGCGSVRSMSPSLLGGNGNRTANGVENTPPPCTHNSWIRSRRRRATQATRLRCLVCRTLWMTNMTFHSKCSGFYSGTCDGSCGKTHIFARGTVEEKEKDEGGKKDNISSHPGLSVESPSLRNVFASRPLAKSRSRRGRAAAVVSSS